MIEKYKNAIVDRIASAIEAETGFKICQYAIKTNERDMYTLRVIFCNLCELDGLKPPEICEILGKNRCTYYNMVKSYSNLMETDKNFRAMMGRIKSKLSEIKTRDRTWEYAQYAG